jgi:hypothetical protein
MWLNKGMSNPVWFRIPASGILFGSGFRHPGSRFNVPIIANFTVLLFYFFEKKKCWNIGTFRLTLLILLKLLHKIEVKCSRKVKYARTVGIKHFFTYDF